MSDLTGELIDGRYQLLRQMAAGGMATIYEAVDTRLDRKVAVKIMHPHLAQDEQFVERFIREAKASAALSSQYCFGTRSRVESERYACSLSSNGDGRGPHPS